MKNNKETNMVIKHGRTALLTLLSAALLGTTLAPPAHAGVATIYQCRTPTGPADTDLMSISGDTAITASLAT
jgi:hypothetical protein